MFESIITTENENQNYDTEAGSNEVSSNKLHA
jgi:hypothetical protein